MSTIGWVLLIVVLLLLVGGLPNWSFHGPHNYGYWPSGGLGLVLIIVVVLIVLGRL